MSQTEIIRLLSEAQSDVLTMKCRLMAIEFQIQKAIGMLEPKVVYEPASKSDDKSIMAEDRNPNLDIGY